MPQVTAVRTTRRITPWLPWILLGCVVVILLLGAWLRRHTLDDSFINYRIVHQIEAGNGPVFNAHERVEAFTSPLWLGLLTLGDLILPIPLEWVGMLGGILAGAVGFVFAGLGSALLQNRRDEHPGTPMLLPLGALMVAVYPPVYRLIASGLEDGLTLAWMGACAWALGRWARGGERLGLPSAVLLGLGVLVRPDLAPFCAAFLLAVVIGDRTTTKRRRGLVVAVAVALPVLSEILRMGYFGVLTPNTAIAKSADLARWGRGWQYLADSVVPYWFWVPIVLIVLVGYAPLVARFRSPDRSDRDTRSALVAGAFVLASLICALYIVRLGGDYMQTRLLLPAIFGFFTPVMFVRAHVLTRRSGIVAGAVAVVWIIVAGLFLRTPSDNRAFMFESQNAVTLSDFEATAPAPVAPPTPPGSVHYMDQLLPYRSARGVTPIAIELGVGKSGFALGNDVYILDGLGLANPIAAHERLRERGWPGHEKLLPQPWIAALSTTPGSPVRTDDFPLPGPIRTPNVTVRLHPQDDPQGRPFTKRVATARGVLECTTVRAFRASYEDPLTLHRFGGNLVHSWRNQRLTIPGEPAHAAAALCTPAERSRISRGGNSTP